MLLLFSYFVVDSNIHGHYILDVKLGLVVALI